MNDNVPPPDFVGALRSLRDAHIDGALVYREIPAPNKLAQFSAAVEIQTTEQHLERPVGRATLVILFDPKQSEVWGGPLRLVGQARVQIDEEQSFDPLLGEAIWKTFTSRLVAGDEDAHSIVGTVTRELSQTFGGLEIHGSMSDAELRCSWTPSSFDLSGNLEAWAETLRENSGTMPHRVVKMERSSV